MNWERHHNEVVRTAASGDSKRAVDLLREHLAGVGCDPLAFRIVAQLRQSEGRTTTSRTSQANSQVPPVPWPSCS